VIAYHERAEEERMQKRIMTVCIIAALSLGATAGVLQAFELEGFAGALTQRDVLNDTKSPVYGLRFGGGGKHLFSGETTFGYSPTQDIKVFLILGNFDINIPVGNVIPYLTIGTGTFIYVPRKGAEILNPDNQTEEAIAIALTTKPRFSLNYGGGVRYLVNDMLALRGDFRDHIIFDLGFDTQAQTAEEAVKIGTSHSVEVSLGLSLMFF
jgi:hypothetical protein